MGTEIPADPQKLDAELAVSLDVLGSQAWTLGGETVGPAEDRKLLPEGTRSSGEPLGRVIRARVTHEAYLEVQRREGGHEIREAGGEPEAPADAECHACPQGVVGDEEYASLDLSARYGLGDVVQETHDAEPSAALSAHPRTDPALRELPLHAPDGLEDVLEGVEVVERSLFLAQGKPELRHLPEQRLSVERAFQRLVNGHALPGFLPRGFSDDDDAPPSCGWCWDCGVP